MLSDVQQLFRNKNWPTVSLAAIFLIILALIPFHGFISTWLISNFGAELFFDSWKEILLVFALLPATIVLTHNPKLFKKLINRRINQLLLLYLIINLLLALFSSADFEAVAAGLVFNLRFLAFFILAQLLVELLPKQKLRSVAWRIVLCAIGVVIAFGLLQMFVLPDDFLTHFGYGPDTIPATFTIDENPDFTRVASTTRGPNPLAALLLTPLIFVGLRFLKQWSWQRGAYLAGGLIVMYGTFSRSAWLGLGAAGLMYVLVFAPEKIKRFAQYAVPIGGALAILGVALLANTDWYQNVVLHTDPEEPGQVDSTGEHFTAIGDGIEDIVDSPLGDGVGTAGPASFYGDQSARISENYFIQIGQEVGIVGLAVFIAISVVVFMNLWAAKDLPAVQALLLAFIAINVANLFLHSWTDEEVAYLWWGLAGLYVPLGASRRQKSS